MSGQEIEGKLIVLADDAAAVFAQVADLPHLGGLHLVAGRIFELTDTYFDTKDAALRARGVALRLRETGGRTLLTLKVAGRVDASGIATREEWEVPYSARSLEELARRLVGLGIEAGTPKGTRPEDALRAAGLLDLGSRATRRTTRDAVGDNESVIAEIALDAVSYSLPRRRVTHFEIEVEGKAGGIEEVAGLFGALRTTLGEAVRTFPYTKVAIDQALRELERNGELDEMLQGDRLVPRAYERIESMLE